MKQLLLGNAAVAQGLYDAGCEVVSSYPGTPSTEITECLAEHRDIYSEWAPNEKVAMETAFGASLGGKRSFCGMKHVGLNVAADPLFTISYTGVNAGMVIAVADDPGMHSSQNEQDSRHYAKAAKLPMLEPADSAECYEFARKAYEISEKYDTPVLLRLCTRIAHSQSIVEPYGRSVPEQKEYAKRPEKYIMMPGYAKLRHPIVEERTLKLTELAETSDLNRVEMGGTELGIIASGTAYQYAKEVFGENASILKLGLVNPLPEKLIKDFAAKVKRVVVIEELDPVVEEHCKAIGVNVSGKDMFPLIDEFSQNLVASAFGISKDTGRSLDAKIPGRPPVMCAGCPHRGMFYALKKLGVTVMGDIGCYTLGAAAPLGAIDTTICMGASVSGLHGFEHSGTGVKAVAVIGDSTFMHSGMTGLVNIAYNGSKSTVIILDNSITGMTGHQQNPTTGLDIHGDPAGKIDLEAFCRAIGINRVRVVDPYDLAQCEQAVREETEADEPSVIISRRPCALLKTVRHEPPFAVDKEKCVGCKSCMRIGCPAISFKSGKTEIDKTLCVGCGVCTQLCKFDSFYR
ncbi:MAG: indolepyruvate ferredoxin oxidoreductase subunit alpha [Oscillospiraceae bacterium]|nr:indolepyruvate ferredoxin oxidoreductase subunit alpha [Oscillospiraceae bacterium]